MLYAFLRLLTPIPIRPSVNSPSIAGSGTEYSPSIVSLPQVMPQCRAIVLLPANAVPVKSISKFTLFTVVSLVPPSQQ